MTSKRVLYFDALNVAACIAVVALHCNQMVHTWQPGKNWMFGLGIEVLFYWAVPIFFMLSGATLMKYRERYDTKTFLKKRFERTVIPFVAWSLILYLLVSVPMGGAHLGIRTFINMMLNNQIEQVYWFFFPLFSIYLSMPLVSLLANRPSVIKYGVATSFVLTSIAPYLFRAIGVTWNGALSISGFGGMLLYVGLGYLLSNHDFSHKERTLIYLLGLLAMMVRYLYTAIASASLGAVDRLFFDYSSFPAVMQAVAVFVLFKSCDFSRVGEKGRALLKELSACSFGVYLIHKPILDHVFLGIFGISSQSILLRTGGVVILYALCVGLVFLLKKVPMVNRILP